MALGCLELIWERCYEAGDDYLGEAQDVEDAACWTGEPGLLCGALMDAGGEGNSGFIDQLEDRPGHYKVHDLYHHAPQYVKKRMEREAKRIEKGVTLSDLRASAARAMHDRRTAQEKMQMDASGKSLHANVLQVDASVLQTAANGHTPAPNTVKDKNPAGPSDDGGSKVKPKREGKPKSPEKTGPTVGQILDDHDPSSYWELAKVFPGARSSNHRTAAVYWVAAINDGIPGPALVKAGRAFFDSLPPDQVSKGAIPQLAKWLEQEGYRTFLPEQQAKPNPIQAQADRAARQSAADAFIKAKMADPSLTFEAWRLRNAS